jgi:hypothetical protein
MLVGYSSSSKVYRVYNSGIGCAEDGCDVQFDETNDSSKENHELNVSNEHVC